MCTNTDWQTSIDNPGNLEWGDAYMRISNKMKPLQQISINLPVLSCIYHGLQTLTRVYDVIYSPF